MFFPEGRIRVFLYGQPTDMRKSYDGLYALARNGLQQDVLSGHLFVFVNRRGRENCSCRFLCGDVFCSRENAFVFFDYLIGHRRQIIFSDHAFADQLLGVKMAGARMSFDAGVHDRLCVARFVAFVMPEAAETR